MLNKTILITVALVTGLVILNGCRRHHHGPMTEKKANYITKKIASKLDLDDNQKAKLNQIKAEMLEKTKSMRNFRKTLADEVINQAEAEKVDASKLNQLFEKHQGEFTQVRKLAVDKFAEFHAMLNSEQKKTMVKYMKKFKKRIEG